MSSPSFGSLYYTDCLPGQGLRGGAGFQFQAVSPDVTHDMMALTQRSTLYEAPVGWMREHRPVEEYPPSLTHVADGCYVTARGVYLGAEANGVREGNQFTHAVATEDAEAYGMVRPAQLWDAPWWSERPAPSTECEPVDAEPEIGPWGIDALREWVLAQQEGEEWLTAVHSAIDRVHDEERRRLVFVSADPAPVLCWVAAATLLLPQARALRVTFRVFATNPHYSEHDVLALHPDWAGQFADTRGGPEFVVFNLLDGTHSPVEPTEATTWWVPRFLRGDPFDVVDAVELAHQFAGTAPRASTADMLASRAVLLGELASDVRECALLTTWLAERAVAGGEDVVPPVVHAVLAGPADLSVLRELDGAVLRHHQADELRARVRRALLDAELTALREDPTAEPPTGSLPLVTWSPTEGAEVTALVEGAANTVAPLLLPRLLRTAARFGVTPREGAFRDGIHRFAQWWADNPGEPVALDGLPSRSALIDQLRDVLAHRFQAADPRRVEMAIYKHLWRVLHPTIMDPATPLDRTVAAATVANGDAWLREEIQKTVMARLVFPTPAHVVPMAWAALFQYSLPDVTELARFLTALPQGEIPRSLAGYAYEVIDEASRKRVSAETLDVLDQLRIRGAKPPNGRLAKFTKESHALRRWSSTIGTTRQSEGAPAIDDLRTVSATVLTVRVEEVLNALLTGTTLANAARAAELGNDDLHMILARHLPEVWENRADQRGDTAVALAFLVASAESCADGTSAKLTLALRNWVSSNESRHPIVQKLLGDVAPELAADWRNALTPGTGQLGPPKVSAPRVTNVDDRAKSPGKKDEKRSRWRLGHRRGRE